MPTVTGDRCRKFAFWIALRGNEATGCFVFKENCDDCAHRKPPKKRKLVAAGNCLRSDCLRRYGFAAHVGLSRAENPASPLVTFALQQESAPASPTPCEHWTGDLAVMLKRRQDGRWLSTASLLSFATRGAPRGLRMKSYRSFNER